MQTWEPKNGTAYVILTMGDNLTVLRVEGLKDTIVTAMQLAPQSTVVNARAVCEQHYQFSIFPPA